MSALHTIVFIEKKKIQFTYRSKVIKKNVFNDDLNCYLKKLKNEEHYIIVDINIDIINPDDEAEIYLNNLYENCFYPLINRITHPTSSEEGNCIDHIIGRKFECSTKTVIIKKNDYRSLPNVTYHQPLSKKFA